MHPDWECTLLLFFACSCLGWLMEVACKLVGYHRFINRGFLIGPYCPIYGVGSVLICRFLSHFSHDPGAVFVLAMVICGVLEYLTSYAMEKLFHARWWDYSHKRFNLNGRVCADTLIPFGLLGLVLVYWLQPLLMGLFDRMAQPLRSGLCAGLCAVMLLDIIVSTTILGKIRKTASLSGEDDTESITLAVRERLAEQGALMRRTLHAFPSVRLYNARLLRRMKAQRERIRQEATEKEQQFREKIHRQEQKVAQELRAVRSRRRSKR